MQKKFAMNLKIGYLTDCHLRHFVPGDSPCPERRSRLVAEALRSCIPAFKGIELLLITGDLADLPQHPDSRKDLVLVKEILDHLKVPKILIPGNHDPSPEIFYGVFPEPRPVETFNGYHFLSFKDSEDEQSHCSLRPETALSWMEQTLKTLGPERRVIMLQHFLVYPEHNETYPHNYKNSESIKKIMDSAGNVLLSLSGHYHPGIESESNGIKYFGGKAFCEGTFSHYEISLNEQSVQITTRNL